MGNTEVPIVTEGKEWGTFTPRAQGYREGKTTGLNTQRSFSMESLLRSQYGSTREQAEAKLQEAYGPDYCAADARLTRLFQESVLNLTLTTLGTVLNPPDDPVIPEVAKLAQELPYTYDTVLHQYLYFNRNLEATRKYLQMTAAEGGY